MPQSTSESDTATDMVQPLAEFRYRLRLFLQFSEGAAHDIGLQPQQHQLLLQIAGCHEGVATTIAWAAERLGLRHNSVVELVDRCVRADLLVRGDDPDDGRRVTLRLTKHGEHILNDLSEAHVRELHVLGPALLRSLRGAARHGATANDEARK
jgi:DNA-binding MarR family transcriptional regulator